MSYSSRFVSSPHSRDCVKVQDGNEDLLEKDGRMHLGRRETGEGGRWKKEGRREWEKRVFQAKKREVPTK